MKKKENHFVMNSIPFFLIDAFTKERFKGNPTAVCAINKVLSDETLQQIATGCSVVNYHYLKRLTHNKTSIIQNEK